jgi:hypothetical protein
MNLSRWQLNSKGNTDRRQWRAKSNERHKWRSRPFQIQNVPFLNPLFSKITWPFPFPILTKNWRFDKIPVACFAHARWRAERTLVNLVKSSSIHWSEWYSLDLNPRTMRLDRSLSPSPKVSYLFENLSSSSSIELVTEVSSDLCECCVDSSEWESTIHILLENNTGFL